MAELTVNGDRRTFEDGLSVSALLERMEIRTRWVAVELNRAIIDRAAFDSTLLRDGDEVEVILPIGGG